MIGMVVIIIASVSMKQPSTMKTATGSNVWSGDRPSPRTAGHLVGQPDRGHHEVQKERRDDDHMIMAVVRIAPSIAAPSTAGRGARARRRGERGDTPRDADSVGVAIPA